jgi:hypothetical protein
MATGSEVEPVSQRPGPVGRPGPRRRARAVAVLVPTLLAAALAACGGDDRPTAPPDLPAGSDAVVIQFSTGGGITGPCCPPWNVPDLTAYGDGRVVVVDTAGVVPALRQATVSRSDLAELLAGAERAGLLAAPPPDTGTLCCDFGSTKVVIADATATRELQVVGLGHEDNVTSELSDRQLRTRSAVAALRSGLAALVEQAGTAEFRPAGMAAYVSASTADGAEPGLWPLDQALAETGADNGCLLLTDQRDVDAVIAATEANPGQVWSSAGQNWLVLVRPLLPHERGCPKRPS